MHDRKGRPRAALHFCFQTSRGNATFALTSPTVISLRADRDGGAIALHQWLHYNVGAATLDAALVLAAPLVEKQGRRFKRQSACRAPELEPHFPQAYGVTHAYFTVASGGSFASNSLKIARAVRLAPERLEFVVRVESLFE